MREIKFRAWHVKNKRMIQSTSCWPKIKLDGSMGDVAFTNNWDSEVWQREEDFILLQYTGLKDKNGNEIYEGDVIKLNGLDDVFEVFFGEVRTSGGLGCATAFGFKSRSLKGCFQYWSSPDFYEVIGNIYENPELLEEK